MTLLLMGDINVDTTMSIDKYPLIGEDAFADRISTQPGGGIVNSAASLAGLGADVALSASTGQDVWAEMVLGKLKEAGVELSRVVQLADATTGLIFLPVFEGERTMFSYRGANELYHPDWLNDDYLQGVELLHFSSYALLTQPYRDSILKAIVMAHNANIPVSVDMSFEPVLQQTEVFQQLLPGLAVCILGMQEAVQLVGRKTADECADSLLDAGVKLVGIKLGKQGALLARMGERKMFPIFNVDTVDTTGAGDSFSSGMIYGYHYGFDLETTGTLASALGALATTVYGGGLGMDWHTKLGMFLEDRQGTSNVQAFGNGIEKLMEHLKLAE